MHKSLFLILISVLIMFSACGARKIKTTEEKSHMSKLKQMDTPVFWAEGHPGKLDREKWTIEVVGLCDKPHTFTWQELQKLPKSEVEGRLTSVTRWSVKGNWGGVSIHDIMQAVQAKPEVKYVRFWSYRMKYDTSIPVAIAEMPKTLLAWEFDKEFLTEDYGGPVRVFCPYLWGYKSAKSVIKVELLDKYIPGYWEKRGYTDSGNIEAGPCRDINDGGKVKDIPQGEVKNF
jgi:DMSO/TMAO reductase YedYZ molybdopterin-dependent catalytic subunit